MTKKYLILSLFAGILIVTGSASAATNCDDQAKPAFDCPTGYSMMCIPVGGDHWGCGKESNGAILESTLDVSMENTKATSATEKNENAEDISLDSSATERVLPTVNKVTDDGSAERLLPTVNKDTDDSSSTGRVLPTVNKKTAQVTVRGWDPDKKEVIAGKIQQETEGKPEINSVDISEDSLAISYSVPVKLLGFIPWTMNLNVSVNANSNVKVKFPWYGFLVRSNFTNSEKQINEAFQNNQTDLEFLKSQDTQVKQIEIFIKISNAMHDMSKSIISNIRA